MYIGDSTVDFCGNNYFMKNTARSEGGGIDARDRVMKFIGKDVFVANSAGSKGAAMHSSSTAVIFQGSSSFGITQQNGVVESMLRAATSHLCIIDPPLT